MHHILELHIPLFYQTSLPLTVVPSALWAMNSPLIRNADRLDILPPFGTEPRRSATSLPRRWARIVSLLREKRSYLVEGDVPIRVMNGLITGCKQSLGDERRTGVYQEG